MSIDVTKTLEEMRQRQAGAHFSDAEVASRVRMLMRDDIEHESICVMARDRIRYLSAALEARNLETERLKKSAELHGLELDRMKQQTIRECAELMDVHNASGSGGLAIREKFGVQPQ